MVDLFFSYSHRDEDLRDELEIHLAMLKRQGLIRAWHDRRIPAGGDVHEEISEHLEEADVMLILVSPYFLASDYCYNVEMRRALERHEAGEARVIPIILEPCDWHNAPFGHLRATPTDGKPVSKFPNLHDAFLEVTQDIRRIAQELGKDERYEEPLEDFPESAAGEPGIRSSNMRVKREFSDREEDKFLDEAFEYIAAFFENSLEELAARNVELEYRFRREGDGEFTAAVYQAGKKKSSCRIWLPGREAFGGDVAYSQGDERQRTSFNDSMRVANDGYSLGFQPLGLSRMGQQSDEFLTPHGAAEYFWSVLISPLQ